MRDYPPLADSGRREHGEPGYDKHESGAYPWIATAAVLVSLAAVLLLSQGNLRNGGAPFVITPPSPGDAQPIE